MGAYAQPSVKTGRAPFLQQRITIDEMFALADQNSKSLRHHSTAINEAREAVNVAKNARLPDIDASLSFSYLGDGYLTDRNFSNGMTAPIPSFGNNFALEVSQVIYAGGAISSGIEIAKLQERNAQLGLEASRNNIRFQLVGYYLDLFKQQNLLQVYEKNIEQTKQVLHDIQAKGNEGIVLKNDITRYELLLANLELARTQIQNTVAILNNHLVTMLGLPADVQLNPQMPTVEARLTAPPPIEHSPDLKRLSLAVQINEHQDKIIKSERLPKLALFAGNHLDGPITIEVPPVNKNLNYWYAGIGINYKLSSLYTTHKAVHKSKFAIQRTKEQYDDAKEQTELAIKADYIRYLETYEQVKTQQKSVELANQNYSVVSNRYKNDMALITDMLDASNAKLSAEVQLSNAQINIIFNYYKLLYISGTL
ncbi:transporter [Bacteroidia bacterium]|nr:transporter [Bacteroidia bacterium]